MTSTTSLTVVIPTYWGRPLPSTFQPGDAIFDHPTPIDGTSTLPRLLESIIEARRPRNMRVLVLVGVVHPSLGEAAEARVAHLISPFRVHLNIESVGPSRLSQWQHLAHHVGLPRETFTSTTYPGIRNQQLLIPLLWGSDVIVALDDDEIIRPDYFEVLFHTLETHPGWGFAGFYENPDGTVLLPEEPSRENIFLDKARIMNMTLRRLLHHAGRWVPSPVAFGGNMVFRASLARTVGFDPYITRGEDIDYVLNAMISGHTIYVDKALRVVHMPPRSYEAPPYARLVEDVYRFFYDRAKMQKYGGRISLNLHPYPGRFFQNDLEEQALQALRSLATPQAVERWGSPEQVVADAQKRAQERIKDFETFLRRWPYLFLK